MMGLERLKYLKAGSIARMRRRHEAREGALEGIEHIGMLHRKETGLDRVRKLGSHVGAGIGRGMNLGGSIGERLASAERYRKKKGDLNLGF